MSVRRESAYWARFEQDGGAFWRFDTRIYDRPRERLRRGDRPIGCIVGKNPGSALPGNPTGELQALALDGDRFLPTVRAIVRKAFAASGSTWPDGGFVQVLNLFYLCNRDLSRAIRSLQRQPSAPICPTERRRFSWTWYAWGGPDRRLDDMKARYLARSPRGPIYFCGESGYVNDRTPGVAERARHTQGMPHGPMVAALSRRLAGVSGAERQSSDRD